MMSSGYILPDIWHTGSARVVKSDREVAQRRTLLAIGLSILEAAFPIRRTCSGKAPGFFGAFGVPGAITFRAEVGGIVKSGYLMRKCSMELVPS